MWQFIYEANITILPMKKLRLRDLCLADSHSVYDTDMNMVCRLCLGEKNNILKSEWPIQPPIFSLFV